MKKERLPATQRVQISHSYQRRRGVPVTQHFQRSVPNTQRILGGLLPVRVLVLQRRKNLVQVIKVRVPHKGPQDPVAPRLVETELQVLGAQIQVGLGAGEAEEKVPVGEVGQLVPCCRGHGGTGGGGRRGRGVQDDGAVDEGREAREKPRGRDLNGEELLEGLLAEAGREVVFEEVPVTAGVFGDAPFGGDGVALEGPWAQT